MSMKKTIRLLTFFAFMIIAVRFTDESTFAAEYYETETNDSYADADTLNLNSTINGVLENYDDVDFYKIVAPANGKISITLNHTYAESYDAWQVFIYKYENGEYICLTDDYRIKLKDNERVTLPYVGAIKNCVYYIKVDAYGDAIGKSYALKTSFTKSEYYEKESNNLYSTATKMTLNKTYDGILNSYDDVDFYKIVAPANGKISISFNHTYAESYDAWQIYIYKYENGEYTCLTDDYRIKLKDNERVTLPYIGAMKNNTYFIKVDAYSGAIGKNYTINTSFIQSDFYEKEINNLYSTATRIALNKTYSGIINDYYDKDFYRIDSPANGKLTISLNHTYEDNNSRWNVYVYRYSNGEYIQLSENYIYLNSSGAQTLINTGVVKNGVYYVKVENSGGVQGKNYTINTAFNLGSSVKVKASSSNTSYIKLSWNRISGMSGYQLQQYKSGKWTNIKDTASNTYTVKGLKAGTAYKFRVRAYVKSGNTKYYGNWAMLNTATKPAKPSILTPSTNKNHQITAKWKKVSGASGYQVQFSKNKNFNNSKITKNVSGNSKTSYKVSNLSKNKKYYIRVRAYKNVNGVKVYGAWSGVKSITCK